MSLPKFEIEMIEICKLNDKGDKDDNDKNDDEAFWGFWKRASSSSGNVFLQKSKAVKALSQHHKRITLEFVLSSRDDDDDDYVTFNISQALFTQEKSHIYWLELIEHHKEDHVASFYQNKKSTFWCVLVLMGQDKGGWWEGRVCVKYYIEWWRDRLGGDWMTESLRESLVQNHLWIYGSHKIHIQSLGQQIIEKRS